MKHRLLVGTVLAGLALGGAALAANAHFVSTNVGFAGSGSDLVVSFKEAGLGDSLRVDYVASGQAAATWACITGGGKNPSASNKRTIVTPVSKPATFTSAKNGSITGSITLNSPPAPVPTDFSCPPGQRLQLAEVSWSAVQLVDKTNNLSAPISGTYTKTLITLKN